MEGWIQTALYFAIVLLAAWPLGLYMARVLEGEKTFLSPILGWLERGVLKLSGVEGEKQQNWKQYAVSILAVSGVGVLFVYGVQRLQGLLPFNGAQLPGVSPDSSFNTAVSFVTNTNWQGYAGESTMSHFTQMAALGVQNFLSAATGIAVLAALIRGIRSKETSELGNAWVDLTRIVVHILLPLSLGLSVFLVSQGVVQTLTPSLKAQLLQPIRTPDGESVTEQVIPLGPAASQVAIKQLGTNGGGYFNMNSAHPLENPTPLSNFVQCLAILLIPAGLCITFGKMIGDQRQGWALLSAMTILCLLFTIPTIAAEQAGNPSFARLGLSSNANWEGKETRFGIEASALWASATTAASNGSVNSMHDSYTPIGGLMPMGLMQLGEVVFGGVGSGLYGMLMFGIISVFAAGLMVGRTPEYLGKKIEPFEMKMASLVILIPCCLVLLGTAISLSAGAGQSSMGNPGIHGFNEILYNYSSMGNNNGSAFAGFNANVPFHNWLGGSVMWISRFWLIIPVLAIAGSLGRKKVTPAGPGTLATHTPLFVGLLCGVVLIVGILTFVPALALGPVAEHLQMQGAR